MKKPSARTRPRPASEPRWSILSASSSVSPVITERRMRQVVNKTLHDKPVNATHWSTRTMARSTGISEARVRRIWRANGLKPDQVRPFKLFRSHLTAAQSPVRRLPTTLPLPFQVEPDCATAIIHRRLPVRRPCSAARTARAGDRLPDRRRHSARRWCASRAGSEHNPPRHAAALRA